MSTETQFNTQSAPTDDQIVEEVMEDLGLAPTGQFSPEIDARRRMAWERDQTRIQDFFDDPFKYVKEFWQQYKSIIINLAIAIAAIFAVKVVVNIISFITSLPLLSPLFELIGFGYSAWFVYRYLLKAQTRQELSSKIEEIKQSILGTTEEIVGESNMRQLSNKVEEIKQGVMDATEEAAHDSSLRA